MRYIDTRFIKIILLFLSAVIFHLSVAQTAVCVSGPCDVPDTPPQPRPGSVDDDSDSESLAERRMRLYPFVIGPASSAKNMVYSILENYPHEFADLIHNSDQEVYVAELHLEPLSGAGYEFQDPDSGDWETVYANPIVDSGGNTIGTELMIPPAGVNFRAGNGAIIPTLAIVGHELYHAEQVAGGEFGMQTESPDMAAAEEDAQEFENRLSGHDFEYENKGGPGAGFVTDGGDNISHRHRPDFARFWDGDYDYYFDCEATKLEVESAIIASLF